jgi:ubiquinone/menaquinone biosynthesis C-methylase UbiE
MIDHTLTEAEAKRFYDRYGRNLDRGEPFEGKAKARARALADAQPGERALEVGIGTGQFLAEATARGARVVGVDLSETMIAISRERAPDARLVRASALRLPLADGAVDLAFSCYLLDLLPGPDIDRALRELARVVRPGGRVVLCGLTEGRSLAERALMGLWKKIHRLSPARVGGCRPLELAPRLAAAGLALVTHERVSQLAVPSEVLLARVTARG